MIHVGDCVEVMAAMPEASIDAVVCDPPYDLAATNSRNGSPSVFVDNPYGRSRVGAKGDPRGGFMGMLWDGTGVAFEVETWREALRVLKPGGHLVAFGGTRTHHRMMVAIEDAGFEIRDCLSWMYGSGFPKSLDVGKAIDQRNGRPEPGDDFRAYLRSAIAAAGMTFTAVDRAMGTNGMVGHWTGVSQPEYPSPRQWARLKALLGLDDSQDYLIEWAEAEREKIGEQAAPIGHAFAGPTYGRDSTNRTIPVTAPATLEAARWEGWGTALKPAWEPIVLARKPLAGTVAGNVLEHGTGALNIDASRVGYEAGGTLASNPSLRDSVRGGNGGHVIAAESESREMQPHDLGRWPANVLLAHDPDCVQVGAVTVDSNGHHPATRGPGGLGTAGHAGQGELVERSGPEVVERWACVADCPVRMLDDQTRGLARAWAAPQAGVYEATSYHISRPQGRMPNTYGDEGGASRFFYCAKASRAERNAGLDGMPLVESSTMGEKAGLKCRTCSRWKVSGNPCTCATPDFELVQFDRPRTANHHPTVKPVEVMRWLVRLVTPPGGTILDPFTGSGTTGIAAGLEGFGFIGVERDEGYADIARRRVAYWALHGAEALERVKFAERGERERATVAQAGQLDLFGGSA